MKRFLLLALLLLVPTVGWAQGNTNTLPPACTAANIATCVPQVEGTIVRMMLGASATDCTTDGGSTVAVCQYDGSSWLSSASVSGAWTGANDETITNGTDGTFTFTRDDAGSVTLIAADDASPASLLLDTTGGGNITIGTSDVNSISLTATGTLTLGHNLANTVNLQSDAGVVNVDGDVTVNQVETATFGAPNLLFATGPVVLNQIIGIPRLNVTQSGGAMPDGPVTSEPWNPLVANCAPITAGTEAAGVTFITGTASYQYTAQATAAEDDGFDCDITGHAVVGTDSLGFWIKSDTVLSAATLDVTLDDGTSAEGNADIPAISVVDEWQWIEVPFATDCDATCADLDGIFIQVTAAGAATSEMDGTVITVDSGALWLSTAEVAIGDVQVGGVISVSAAAVAAGTANTPTELVEYTDYIVNYQTGADALVILSDQSANYGTTLEALN